jgi:hypothetical protein
VTVDNHLYVQVGVGTALHGAEQARRCKKGDGERKRNRGNMNIWLCGDCCLGEYKL